MREWRRFARIWQVSTDATREETRTGPEPVVTETPPETPLEAPPDRRWWRWRWVTDGLALISYAALAIYVMSNLWYDPGDRLLSHNRNDHGVFIFFMAHGERVMFHGESPLWTDRMNVPDGVNMMANTSMLAASLPLSPVTHWWGPAVTVALLLTLGLGGTAAAWYWFLSRHVVESPVAAWAGGLFAGFAPGFISQASGHPNFTAGFLMPFIVRQALRLREPGRIFRSGILLGLLAAVQIFLSEEMLLFCAVPLFLFILIYALFKPRVVWKDGPRFLAGGLVAIVVAGALVAYPLWYQFMGPGHYRGVPFVIDRYATSLGSVIAYPRQSVTGNPDLAQRLSTSATEDNAFWGVGFCFMILVSIAVLWRSLVAWALLFAGLFMLVMSFGTHFRINATPGTVTAPLGWIGSLPAFDSVTVPRYALPASVVFAVLLALAIDRVRRSRRLVPRIVFRLGVVAALAPLFPVPVPTFDAPPIPAFFADQMWKPYVTGGRSVVPVPLPEVSSGWNSQRVASLANLAFPVPRGYFIGPRNPPADLTSSWRAFPTYTSTLIGNVQGSGKPPKKTAWRARLVRQDMHFWKAGVVVLMPDAKNRAAVLTLLTDTLGKPQQGGGVDYWDTRYLS
jgi:hypothetical protein